MTCKWCGKALPSRRRRFCSDECVRAEYESRLVRKPDKKLRLTQDERKYAAVLLTWINSRVRQHPGLKPCVSLDGLREAWPYIKDIYKGVIE